MFILDVRDKADAMQGMLKGSKNIPFKEITVRLNEIPKDKEIITLCGVGIMSEMAYHILKDAGYKARYLDAFITINKDGGYKITKE